MRWLAVGVALLAMVALAPDGRAQDYGGDTQAGSSHEPDTEGAASKRSWGRREARGGGLSQRAQRNQKRLAEAYEHLYEERYDECEEVLKKFRMRSLDPEEKAQVFRVWAFVSYGRGDLASARDYLQQTLDENGLPPDEQAAIQYQIAQIYLSEQQWAKVVESLKKWFAMVEKPNSAAYYLLGIAYYQLGDLDDALAPAQKAVDLADKPQEGWLQLLLALRLTRREYPESVPLLEQLVARFPKKTYWIQLSTVHGALGHYEEALVPLQLAYAQGLLETDAEVSRLAELLLFLDLPFRAGEVIAKGLDDQIVKPDARAYELLANSRIASRDYEDAVEPLTRAAELADNGELYIRLAQVHLQREKWEEAADALRRAIEKGNLDNPGDAQLLMGIAFYSQKRADEARSWFARASEHASTQKEADIWLKHIDRELAAAG